MALAAAFAFAAGVAVVVPHRTGLWLPLHLFLVGALLLAISGATQFLAVTWSAAAPPSAALVGAQRMLLVAGVLGVGVGRELSAPSAVLGAAGFAVIAALVLLQVSLLRIRTTSRVERFRPAIDGYLVAVAFGLVGCGAGVVLASGAVADRGSALRSAHLIINLFGLVGIVVAVTLPYMVATQIRSKMAPRATRRALRSLTGLLAAATVLGSTGALRTLPSVACLGFGIYAVGIAATVALCPRIHLRQLHWAGPRLGLLATGVLWWAGATAGLAVIVARGHAPPTDLLLALVIGGYAQILAGSLAYLAPVLRGGGHVRLTAGFSVTRSPIALVAANAAALGALAGAAAITITGVAVWLTDTAVRAGLLIIASKGTSDVALTTSRTGGRRLDVAALHRDSR
jgi:nitrite reductase (NO-forming)